jgi:hypothetical protein
MFEFCTTERNVAPPGADMAVLEVRIELIGGHARSLDGRIFATPFMITKREVDEEIDGMIARLERVRIEAKNRLEENAI